VTLYFLKRLNATRSAPWQAISTRSPTTTFRLRCSRPIIRQGPHLEELQSEREDIRVVKLNVDDNPHTAATYNVMSIPMLLLFKHGQVAHQIIGAMPKSRLLQEIEPALAA